MLNKLIPLVVTAVLVVLVLPSEVDAYGAAHVGYTHVSPNGAQVVTELQPLADYSRAEAYHQHYFANHPHQGYCAFVVAPKVEKFRRTYKARLRA